MNRKLSGVLGALGLLLGWLAPAKATILFAGTEDFSFLCDSGATCGTTTTGGGTNFRSAYSRSAFNVSGSGATNDPPTNRFTTIGNLGSATFTATQEIWLHFIYTQTSNGTDANAQLIRFKDDAGNAAIIARGTGSAGQIKFSSRTSGGVFTDLVTCSATTYPSSTPLQQIDIDIKLAASGFIHAYANGVDYCDFVGDTTNGDASTKWNNVTLAGAKSTDTSYYSEVIVATTNTNGMGYLSSYANAAGNQTQFTGTNACTTILNNNPVNDASFAATATNSQTEQCATYNTLPSGVFTVEAVIIKARALRGAAGPQNFQFDPRVGGTDYPGTNVNPTTSFANYSSILATNPATSAAWTTSDVSGSAPNLNLSGVFSQP